MFRISEPSEQDAVEFVSSQRNLSFTYAEVGATNATPPASGYIVDHNRVRLGDGEAIYQRAVAALKYWRQFDLGWVSIAPHGVVIDGRDRLWVIDHGNWLPNPQPPKLLAFDIASRKLAFRHDFDKKTAPAGQILQDLAVDGERGFVYVADCVAQLPDDYCQIAAGLGTDRDRRAALRDKILSTHGVLFENAAAVRELEDFFERIGRA